MVPPHRLIATVVLRSGAITCEENIGAKKRRHEKQIRMARHGTARHGMI